MEALIKCQQVTTSVLKRRISSSFIQRRWKGKIKYPLSFQYRRPSDPHELAKEFFDGLYSKRFGNEWPSIRCAMLSRKKYAAILNNHSNCEATEEEFLESGAVDIIGSMQEKAKLRCQDIEHAMEEVQHHVSHMLQNAKSSTSGVANDNDVLPPLSNGPVDSNNQDMLEGEYVPDSVSENRCLQQLAKDHLDSELQEELNHHRKRTEWLENELRIYKRLSNTCNGLKVYAYEKGDLTEFEEPLSMKRSGSTLNYFLLDGSSILPILALDPQPQDHVLDMCAAPGGKLMCIMQLCVGGSGSIVANDVSKLRVNRIRKVQDEYIQKDHPLRKRMKVMNIDATSWSENETSTYDKVLVDVPCTQDRHSVLPSLEARDNIFSQLRKRERANLPGLQSDILRNAVMACRPGGHIVYSTCTASKQQNEYVVQMTVQQLLHNYGVVCEIEDLTPLAHLMKQHFYFFPDSELGVLALPFLDANFGPTYVCKLVRKR